MNIKGLAFHLTMLILGVVGAAVSITTIAYSLMSILTVKNAK